MSTKKAIEQKKKLNVPALISLLMVILVFPLMLIPWYRLFVLRSNTLTTLLIHVVGIMIIGMVTLILVVIAVALSRKHKGEYQGTWMAWVGMVLGVVELGIGLFFVIDYLRFVNT